MLSDFKTILFDVDGVLLDSEPVMAKAWASVQSAVPSTRDIPFNAYFAEIGREFNEILQRIQVPEQDWDACRTTYFARSRELDTELDFFTDIIDTVVELRKAGRNIGLVTSKSKAAIDHLLEREPWFSWAVKAYVCPDNLKAAKPNPAPIYWAAGNLHAGKSPDMSSVVYIGDMPVDAEAAAAAGVHFIHAAWGYGALMEPNENVSVCFQPQDLLPLLLPRR